MLRRLRVLLPWLAFWLLCSMLLLELALRLLTLLAWDTPLFVSDERLIFRLRSSIETDGKRTNLRGFNDVDHPDRPASGVARWAAIGDSYVFGAVPLRDNLVEGLRRQRPDIEWLNLGVPAAGPENYLALFEHEAALRGAAQAIVVFFVGNDVQQAHPDFQTRLLLGAPRALLRSPWQAKLSADYLYVLKLGRGAWRTFHERSIANEPGGTFSREIFLEVERKRLEICRRVPSAMTAASYRGTATFFQDLAQASRRLGVPAKVVLAPDQAQVDPALQRDLFAYMAEPVEHFDLDLPQRLLAAQLEAAGLPFLDLTPGLRAAAGGAPLYLERDTHWNAAGNRWAAERIAAWLAAGAPAAAYDSTEEAGDGR
jgi:hypothetical protein